MTSTEIYIPPYAKPISQISFNQIRLGIIGEPNSGKTYSALSFPNPIIANFDNKLGAHMSRQDITVIPFNDPKFIIDILKISNAPFGKGRGTNNPNLPPNRRDAFIDWLRKEASKLTSKQTLIIDSWTTLQAAIKQQIDLEPVFTKKNEPNEYAPWQALVDFNIEICEMLKGLPCNVVVTFHEIGRYDPKTNEILEKKKPLMQGQFVAQLAGHFTDWFKQHAIAIRADPADRKSEIIGTKWLWQTKSDNEYDLGSQFPNMPRFVKANYQSIAEIPKQEESLKEL